MYTYKYPRPALTVDAIVLRRHECQWQVLLVERGIDPFKGKWALPGGFVNMDELLENACIRELKEETGLQVAKMIQFKTFDAINRDPRHRTISVVHYTVLKDDQKIEAGDDAKKVAWFPVTDLPELAFDHSLIFSQFVESNYVRFT